MAKKTLAVLVTAALLAAPGSAWASGAVPEQSPAERITFMLALAKKALGTDQAPVVAQTTPAQIAPAVQQQPLIVYQSPVQQVQQLPATVVAITQEISPVIAQIDTPTLIANYVSEGTQTPADGITRDAEMSYIYSPGGLYTVYTQPGFLTDVKLAPGEEITSIVAGDTARWQVERSFAVGSWHVYVKPLKAGLETNLIVNTNRHSYQLLVKSTTWRNPIVSWIYPQEQRSVLYQAPPEKASQNDILAVLAVPPDLLNYDYKVSRTSLSWAPLAVFDDTKKVYIKLPENLRELPTLIVKERGEIIMVNQRFKQNYFIVDRLFSEAELRIGKNEVVKIKRN